MSDTQLFHYKTGNTFLHRMSSWLKLLLMIAFAIGSFYIPFRICAFLWIFIIFMSFYFLKFSVKEILTDLKPSIAYFIMIYASSLILNISVFVNSHAQIDVKSLPSILLPNTSYLSLFLHLGLSMQITSVFFRTTSSMQFNEGLSAIERKIRKSNYTPIADLISLTITFIPRISCFWNRIDTSWKARGGKESIKKITALTPILFRVSMNEAYLKALARQNRTEYNFFTKSEVYICDAPHAEDLMTK